MKESVAVVFFIFGDSPDSEFYVPYTTYKDGTDIMFRNVGTYNSDAEE
jgi:hypothetical protein